jgi:hypothetical protein
MIQDFTLTQVSGLRLSLHLGYPETYHHLHRFQAILAFLSMEFDLADTNIGFQYFVKSL